MMAFKVFKEITVDEVFDAIEKDGLPKLLGSFYRWEKGEIVAGCAFGQAAINLGGISAASLQSGLATISRVAAGKIIYLNDNTPSSLPEIAETMRKHYSKRFRARKFKVYF